MKLFTMQFFFPLLTLIFITLKLTMIIDWSWWIVLAPLYPGLILALAGIWAIILAGIKLNKK